MTSICGIIIPLLGGGCPGDGNKKNIKENDKNNPYKYKDQTPIVLKPSDSLLQQWLESGMILKEVKKDTEPVL